MLLPPSPISSLFSIPLPFSYGNTTVGVSPTPSIRLRVKLTHLKTFPLLPKLATAYHYYHLILDLLIFYWTTVSLALLLLSSLAVICRNRYRRQHSSDFPCIPMPSTVSSPNLPYVRYYTPLCSPNSFSSLPVVFSHSIGECILAGSM